MEARAHIFISGRVQGVCFRDYIRQYAGSFNLTGWVKNLVNGRIEALVEGEKEKIEHLIGKMKEGPPLSWVNDVEVEWEQYKGEFSDFRITW
ncbi:MAG: acylphosphatase [Candidatus Aminicenantes bacterium]|nr:acylphosphatase [Candidatus Aminicenantes bacterium]